jgi:hypothetical protein
MKLLIVKFISIILFLLLSYIEMFSSALSSFRVHLSEWATKYYKQREKM